MVSVAMAAAGRSTIHGSFSSVGDSGVPLRFYLTFLPAIIRSLIANRTCDILRIGTRGGFDCRKIPSMIRRSRAPWVGIALRRQTPSERAAAVLRERPRSKALELLCKFVCPEHRLRRDKLFELFERDSPVAVIASANIIQSYNSPKMCWSLGYFASSKRVCKNKGGGPGAFSRSPLNTKPSQRIEQYGDALRGDCTSSYAISRKNRMGEIAKILLDFSIESLPPPQVDRNGGSGLGKPCGTIRRGDLSGL